MKTKNKQRELLRLIITLVESITQINTLPPESKLHDVIGFEDQTGKFVAHRILMTWSSDGGSWVLTDRDKPPWDEVIRELCDRNPKIVSPEKVTSMLYNFISQYARKQWSLSGLPQDAEDLINSIVNERGRTARVFLPIWGFLTKVSPFVIGEVAFEAKSECSGIQKDLAKFESARQLPQWGEIHTIAITESSGDDHMLVRNAETKVNEALNLFRAFTQPIVQDPAFKQMGIMGTFHMSEKLYYLEGSEVSTDVSPKMRGGGFITLGTRDTIINKYLTEHVLADMGFYKMSKFLTSSHSELAGRLLRGAQWLGEATKPDTLESKFLKVAFAVDAMIGDVAEDIPDRGQRARIAERSAFLLADEPGERRRIYDDMSDFFKKRGKLAHGSTEEVSQWETARFGMRARELLVALLRHEQNLKTKDELAEWVLRRSFNGVSQLDTGA